MTETDDQMLSGEELDSLQSLLARLKPGFQRADIFRQLRRLVVSSIVEIVPIRQKPDGGVEVLMMRRPDDDLVEEWRGKLHTPGTSVRATDTDGLGYMDAKARLLQGEIGSMGKTKLVFVGNMLHQVEVGKESAQVFYMELTEEPSEGAFYPADRLPPDTIESQIGFIGLAVEKFKQDHDLSA